MKAKTLTTKYLGALNDGFEAVETDDGFVVWMPAYYSDDDGVILSVRRAAGGWTVTDDGSTLSGLRTRGAATDAPAFLEAWGRLARPAGDFVPGRDSDDGEITGWATDETLGDVLNLVALASVRAEGLALIRERGSAERFPARVGRRITSLMSAAECTDRGLVRGSTVGLVSGRRTPSTPGSPRSSDACPRPLPRDGPRPGARGGSSQRSARRPSSSLRRRAGIGSDLQGRSCKLLAWSPPPWSRSVSVWPCSCCGPRMRSRIRRSAVRSS